MPLAKPIQNLTAPRKILLSVNGIAELASVHRDAVMRELARGSIQAEAWLDARGRLYPVFLPTVAVEMARLGPRHAPPIPPAIS